jgi:Uma2 family endonuclease
MAVAVNDVHRWSREDYERMAAKGFFAPDARVELLDGIVYDMTPQSGPHASAVHRVLRALQSACPASCIRVQSPLALADDAAPEPDLAVVPGLLDDYDQAHPNTALLVVEVADSSLAHDKSRKIPLYARAGIPEAWLLSLKAKALEVFRDPSPGGYRTRQILRHGEAIAPLTGTGSPVAVADLLPKG